MKAIVTVKFKKNPYHNPENKLEGICPVGLKCTDVTGEHHSILIEGKNLDEIKEKGNDMSANHITRIEVIQGNELTKEIKELLKWTPVGVDLKAIGKVNYPPKDFPKKEYGEIVTDEDCQQPFISESYLYPLLGKEDARTLLALLKHAFKSVGIILRYEDGEEL